MRRGDETLKQEESTGKRRRMTENVGETPEKVKKETRSTTTRPEREKREMKTIMKMKKKRGKFE